MLPSHQRFEDDRAVAGAGVLALGFLTFIMGGLLVANAWGVIDAKIAASSAAREAVRAYVEAPDAPSASARANRAADATLVGFGRSPAQRDPLEIQGTFARCERIVVTVTYQVPSIGLGWLGGWGGTIAAAGTHSELVDPFRSGLEVDQDGVTGDCV